jgi:oxygen-independent coproporphyrinogen-3 oxidase
VDPEGQAFRIFGCMRLSIYLHIPFCTHRCAYCDFNTYAGQSELIPAYVDALCHEVEIVARATPADCAVHTIFFGGGTPSLLSAAQVGRVLTTIRGAYHLEDEVEVTLEANPGTVLLPALQDMRRAGVNRISLGVQSANGEELRTLERTHDFGDVLRAVADTRRAGFANLNLDLIYGLPEQDAATWRTTLRRILDVQPEHISAYCLTLEHGTPFGRWTKRGLMPVPDPDAAADMYEAAERELARAGYDHYEISNWARPGRQCRHNLQYWKTEPYLGFGAGAHGYAAGYRYSNVLGIRQYIARLEGTLGESAVPRELVRASTAPSTDIATTYPCSPAAKERHEQSIEDELAEFMIMGLRLVRDGIPASDFYRRFERALTSCYSQELERLAAIGLVEWIRNGTSENADAESTERIDSSEVLRLTSRGRLLGNQVFMSFLS